MRLLCSVRPLHGPPRRAFYNATSACPSTVGPVTEWIPVIAAASGLVGAGIGGAITFATQRADRRDRARGDLAAALITFGYALDSLQVEIARIPPRTRAARVADTVINERRFPNLNFLLNSLHSATLGRSAGRALDRLLAALNRLLLLAPADMMPLLEEINELLATVSARDAEWDDRWRELRGRLTAASRQMVSRRSG
jgi:hypothetical protein